MEHANDNGLRTNHPRILTFYEILFIRRAGRIKGIQLHMCWTNSTVRAAVRAVDEVMVALLSGRRPLRRIPSGFVELGSEIVSASRSPHKDEPRQRPSLTHRPSASPDREPDP
jgi:hypothetical protein